jgi:hypothetical protein
MGRTKGVRSICKKCGVAGHLMKTCGRAVVNTDLPVHSKYGPYTVGEVPIHSKNGSRRQASEKPLRKEVFPKSWGGKVPSRFRVEVLVELIRLRMQAEGPSMEYRWATMTNGGGDGLFKYGRRTPRRGTSDEQWERP